ncbi:Phosphoribosylglycinamide formyltransferase [bacterium HR29]|nr:Phosphoribosylglycinamide formyltransferase [bacterium HR29]
MSALRVAWLTTGRGQGSYGALEYVLRAIDAGLPVEIAVVFVNREPGEAEPTDRLMELVRARGIPLETLSSVRFRKARGGERSRPGFPLPAWRREFDREVAERLRRYRFDLGVLFGYMLIVTEELYERFTLINDHPALPDGPTGPYEEVILELIRQGATESGCMYHVVTGDVDRGPVIAYCRYPIRDEANEPLWQAFDPARGTDDPLWQDIRARGLLRERPFVAETLRAIAEGRLAVPPEEPVDLTDAVEAAVRAGSPRP